MENEARRALNCAVCAVLSSGLLPPAFVAAQTSELSKELPLRARLAAERRFCQNPILELQLKGHRGWGASGPGCGSPSFGLARPRGVGWSPRPAPRASGAGTWGRSAQGRAALAQVR